MSNRERLGAGAVPPRSARGGHGRKVLVLGLWALGLVVIIAIGWLGGSAREAAIHDDRQSGFSVIDKPAPAPDFRLIDSDGRVRWLHDYRGRWVILYFGFTHCPEACPVELFSLAQVMKGLGEERKKVQVLLVTLDPERDTPQLLKGYVGAFDSSFVGLTGSVQQIDAVAASYHVVHLKVALANDYTIDHSSQTFLIGPDGGSRLVAEMGWRVDDMTNELRRLFK